MENIYQIYPLHQFWNRTGKVTIEAEEYLQNATPIATTKLSLTKNPKILQYIQILQSLQIAHHHTTHKHVRAIGLLAALPATKSHLKLKQVA